jgi:para-nitrobenzyl esterase
VKDNPAQALWSLSIYLQKGAAMLVRYFSRYCDHATQAILFTLLVLLNGVVCAEPVKIESGMVQGTIEDGLYVYRGIPYAAPPLGDLRWRAPQTAPKWQGVLAANAFGRACIQSNPAIANLPAPSEDCLYLNIWTPIKHAEKRLPVMVWIHGGGFIAGATAEQLYHGEHIAKKGVIVVTIGYRLGILGFLAHPDLNAENDRHVSGNYGLLDMIAALRWVQRNISAFGGDPKRVTIFGESAGGIAVSMLCASPLAKELFHGAISQSGGSFGPVRAGGGPGENVQSLADGERAGETWALKAGVSNLSEMRRLPPDKLVTAGPGGGVAWPIMDGWIVPDDQYKLYQAGRYNDTPTLVGYNSDEGATFPGARAPEAYVESVRQRYGSFAQKLLALYPAGEGTLAKTARDLQRDTAFGWHTWTWCRLQSKTGKSKAFLYYFDHHPEYPAGSPKAGFGAAHSDEMPLVFQQFGLPGRPTANASDQAMSEIITIYWTNFAKSGDPNGAGLPIWPAYSNAKPQAMHFLADTAQAGPVINKEGLEELDAYFEWRRTAGADTAAGSAPANSIPNK